MFMIQEKICLLYFFYKSSIKSLLSLCITIVLRVYCEADLLKLKLSKGVHELLKKRYGNALK